MARVNQDPGFFEFTGIPDIQNTYSNVKIQENSAENIVLTNKTKNYACEALLGVQEVSHFSRLFFSDQNITELQKLIKYNVWIESDKMYKIDNQDENELKIVMRAVYLMYQKGIPTESCRITSGIKRLNTLVINQILPDLLSNITQYIGYIKDASTPLQPLPPPVNMDRTGNKQYRDITQVLFGQSVADYNSKFY